MTSERKCIKCGNLFNSDPRYEICANCRHSNFVETLIKDPDVNFCFNELTESIDDFMSGWLLGVEEKICTICGSTAFYNDKKVSTCYLCGKDKLEILGTEKGRQYNNLFESLDTEGTLKH